VSARTTDRVFLGAEIPANYKTGLLARAAREDRSISSVVRSALGAFLFREAGLRALGELEREKEGN
jgi:hypothetical protein